jgi:hypothetical protein
MPKFTHIISKSPCGLNKKWPEAPYSVVAQPSRLVATRLKAREQFSAFRQSETSIGPQSASLISLPISLRHRNTTIFSPHPTAAVGDVVSFS